MTRIRTHKSALCCMLLFSLVLLAAGEEPLLDVFGETSHKFQQSTRVRSSSSRRRLQDDKNNDKNDDKDDDKNNDKDATSAPTLPPSISPAPSPKPTTSETTSPQQTITPWPTTSPYPTISPSPTISPDSTMAPTFSLVENSVGNLVMQLTIDDSTTNAADVNQGRANTLLDGVLAGMLEILCRMHYIMVVENSFSKETRACPESRRFLFSQSNEKDDFPVVWTMSRVVVQDYIDDDTNNKTLMYWQVAYPVLDIGAAYTNWAMDQGASDDDVNATALNAMNEDAFYATQIFIQRGDMDTHLPETATAIADEEQDAPSPAPGSMSSEPLDPDAFHPMRVAGMILLIVTLVSTLLLVKCSARRKKEREEDSAIAKINKGGLVTEEGLDLMLDVGRKQSENAGLTSTEIEVVLTSPNEQQQNQDSTMDTSSDGEEQNRMLPLPGYLKDGNSAHHQMPPGAVDKGYKEEAVLEAAKDSDTDVNKSSYSFLSIFGRNEEDDSEQEEVVLPQAPNDGYDSPHEETITQSIAGFMNMFSKSSDSAEGVGTKGANEPKAPGSEVEPAPPPDAKDTVKL